MLRSLMIVFHILGKLDLGPNETQHFLVFAKNKGTAYCITVGYVYSTHINTASSYYHDYHLQIQLQVQPI